MNRTTSLLHSLFASFLWLPLLSDAAQPAPNPTPATITLEDFKLTGDLGSNRAAFTLTATAQVDNPKGGSLELLSGTLALTELSPHPKWRLRAEENQFIVTFDRPGKYPLKFKFNAAVRQNGNWNGVDFRVAPSALQPIVLRGLAADTQFEFAGAARPERTGGDFMSYLPADGAVKLAWKETRPEAEGKLFFAAEMLSQISLSPGLMRQVGLVDFKIMQGELSRVALLLRGTGEVTRVQGEQVLAWNVEPAPNSNDRRLVVQFNQPQKDQFALQIQVQTPLGAFPQTVDAVQLRPEGATRFAGYFRVVNEGAVRLEVAQATGLSQISPEQFPESGATRAALRATGSQRFAYRFSGPDFALRIQADQILPELAVSQLLAYRLGENEQAIDAEFELDVREAPLRELLLRVPKGYAIAQLAAAGLSDYFLREPADAPDAELRLVFGQPVSGRQVVQLRLERNKPLAGAAWALPRLEVAKAKSVRGHIAATADTGFRLTPDRTQALTEIATAFFPRKVAGIQSAFRLSDPAWQASLRVERLPQTVQADALHLYSIGEGIAYGSSLLNYVVSGAPVAAFKVELSPEYFNVEFIGKDIRNWQKATNGYLVQLHTPVAGAYTLLATYERPFKPQGETLTFTGARPLDAQSEQGHTLIISAYQFQVKPEVVSRGLLRLETGEVPPEYRLFFDAPLLAAFRYTSRPFDLKLALSPLAQEDSLSQVVDRASITNRISKEGQVLTDARYFVKNRGNPHFRLTLPPGTDLWAASVNGTPVVPVIDAQTNLIPLPQHADPNQVLMVDLKLAAKAKAAERVRVSAPIVNAPVLLAEWRMEPDTGQRLVYRGGSLTPAVGAIDDSGFAGIHRTFTGYRSGDALVALVAGLIMLFVCLGAWHWASQPGVYLLSARHCCGTVLGLVALGMAAVQAGNLIEAASRGGDLSQPRELSFVAPVQQPGSALSLDVANIVDKATGFEYLGYAWPVVLALAVWFYGWISVTNREGRKIFCRLAGWMLVAWAALRCPNGVMVFLGVMAAFLVLQVLFPAARRLWQLPRPPQPTPPAPTESTSAPAATALLIGGLLWGCTGAAYARADVGQTSGLPVKASSGGVLPAICPGGTFENSPTFQRWVTQDHHYLSPEGTVEHEGDSSAVPSGLTLAGCQIPTLKRWAIIAASLRDEILKPHAPLDGISSAQASLRDARQSQHPAPRAKAHGYLHAVATRPTHGVAVLARRRPAPHSSALTNPPPVAESVIHDIRIEDKFALGTAKIHWQAEKGEALPLILQPAVLTRVTYPTNLLRLEQAPTGSKVTHRLLARQSGAFNFEVRYELQMTQREKENGLVLPIPHGLVNQVTLTVANLAVDVLSPQAVSLEREAAGSNTVAKLVLAPANEAWIGWQPRSRDVKREKPVFYADLTQLYVPAAGVIEGAHLVVIRPAQGELSELVLDVPAGATVTDVTDPAKSAAPAEAAGAAGRVRANSLVSLWRFDPDTRKLRVTLNPAQSRPFMLLVRSQIATGPLPFGQSFGLVSVENAAGQIGLLGVATGNEVQLDGLNAEGFSPINLEDFPADAAATLQGQIAGLTVRRAFRYSGASGTPTPVQVALKASAVEPDVRVETQDTLSLGEDRTVLAADATVNITRAGIFRLSFVMPAGFDVESISGSALSHWTESKTEAGRVITLHLTGKTEGQQRFAISLAGPGVKGTKSWQAPQLMLREAGKQRGTLLLVPEQGLRLQVGTCDGVTQLDPLRSGVRQKGVLAFRILQMPWSLDLGIEQVDPWIQVTSLQHATVNEAQVKVAANLQYQIDNTGLKALRVFLPTNAESVRFQGEQVADFMPVAGLTTNGLQAWEIKLHRRVIGSYLLQAIYQTLVPEQASETTLRGVQAGDVNLQRGFVTVESAGRLQMRVETPPAALQPTEWQSIPRALQQDLSAAAANFTYRLVEPTFELPLKLERHEAAKLLDARVNQVTFTSVISDAGVMLTQARLELQPGDKRLLNVQLPKGAQFWFAFVNQNGVWPWRDSQGLLIPLEQQPRGGKAIPVELFYSCRLGAAAARSLDFELVAPKFDLPLENITWQVTLDDKWQVKHWSGSLQLQQERLAGGARALDLSTYLQNEAVIQQGRTREAEDLLAAGNNALQQGAPQQARRAFQAAYGLSSHDMAFNEDARVQLHNIKLQQALIGLNVRQAATAGDPATLGSRFRDLRKRKEVNYTQQDAKAIIDRNSADENAAFLRLAERLIQQQDAAVSSPAALRANLPEQGRVLTFKRSVAVDPKADLKIALRATASATASVSTRLGVLGGTFVFLAAFGWGASLFRRKE